MRRHLIGVLAILLVAGAVYFWITPPVGAAAKQMEAACWRVGTLCTVLWAAFPQVHRLPGWIWAVSVAALLAVAVKPRLALAIVPVIIALAILRPRIGKKKV